MHVILSILSVEIQLYQTLGLYCTFAKQGHIINLFVVEEGNVDGDRLGRVVPFDRKTSLCTGIR